MQANSSPDPLPQAMRNAIREQIEHALDVHYEDVKVHGQNATQLPDHILHALTPFLSSAMPVDKGADAAPYYPGIRRQAELRAIEESLICHANFKRGDEMTAAVAEKIHFAAFDASPSAPAAAWAKRAEDAKAKMVGTLNIGREIGEHGIPPEDFQYAADLAARCFAPIILKHHANPSKE